MSNNDEDVGGDDVERMGELLRALMNLRSDPFASLVTMLWELENVRRENDPEMYLATLKVVQTHLASLNIFPDVLAEVNRCLEKQR